MKINNQSLAYLSIFIFLILNLYFLFTVDSKIRSINDGYNIINISDNLIFGKDYISNLISVQKPPLYIVLVNIINKFFNTNINFLIVLQLFCAFITAVVAEKIYEIFFNKRDYFVFTLVLLNPNLLAHANFVLTETIYSLLLTTVFFYYLKWYKDQKINAIFFCGLFLGLASLTRYEGIYLSLLIILLIFFVMINEKKIKFFLKSILIFTIAIFVSYGPWFISKHNSNLTNIGNSEKELEHLSWNITLLESITLDEKIDLNLLHDNKIELEAKEEFYQSFEDIGKLSNDEITNWYRKYYLGKLLSYPLSSYTELWARSTIKFFFASGSSYLNILFGNIDVKDPENFILTNNIQSDSKYIKNIVLTINFLLKVLSIIGFFILLFKIKNHKYLAVIMFILFSFLIVIFNGHARSRLPIECLLFLLTIYGYNYLTRLLKKKKNE